MFTVRLLVVILAVLACNVAPALSECMVATDEACAALNREICDPNGSEDLCGACAVGTQEGPSDGSNSQPACVPITCRVEKDTTANPATSASEVAVGATVQFNCIEGYWTSDLNAKAFTKWCADSGELQSDSTCVPLSCAITNDVANATAASTDPVTLGSATTYVCLPGYATVAKGTSLSRTCTARGTLTAPTERCVLFNACEGVTECGKNAECVDLPPPSLDYECRCTKGYIGTAGPSGTGCYRVNLRTSDEAVHVTALDFELFQPEKNTRLSLHDLVEQIADITTSIAQANAASADADRVLGVRIDDANRRVDAVVSSVNNEISRARSAETSIQATVSAETLRASTSEAAIQSTITRTSGDLQTARNDLAAEISRAISAEASINVALGNRITTASNSLTSEVSRAMSAESSVQVSVNSLSGTVSTIRVDLTTEVSRAISAEGSISTGVSSVAVSMGTLSGGVVTLSTAHSTTRSITNAVSTSISSETVRAVSTENSISTTVSTIRSDLTVTQGTLTNVGNTVTTQSTSISSLASSLSTLVSQVNSLATAMTAQQTSIGAATTSAASQSTALSTANSNIVVQTGRINTLSTTVSTLQTTTNTLSTSVASLSGTVSSVSTGVASVTGRVNLMTTTSCDQANGWFVFGYTSAGNAQCAQIPTNYLRNWYNSKCWAAIGWLDSCNGCGGTPFKSASMYASGACRASSGTNNFCSSGWAGINTDGTVNDDDNFYTRIACDA